MKKGPGIVIQDLPPDLTPERLPTSLYEKPYFFLLESSLQQGARYSIAAWDPLKTLEISEDAPDPFKTIQEHLREFSFKGHADLPFSGGWIGYFGYEMYSQWVKKVPPRRPNLIPKAVFCFYDRFYLYDHLKKRPFLIAMKGAGGTANAGAPWPLGCHSPRENLGEEFRRRRRESSSPLASNFTKHEYLNAVSKIKSYITAGDCYQVNLSQKFTTPTTEGTPRIYQRLRAISPSPYAAYLNLGTSQILSSSPECLLQVEGRNVITRPIKGTRPRGQGPEEDDELRRELDESAKDRAELLMITDLERNDLGRVCRPGSVSVPELRRIETFPQVHHLVATIRGELSPEKNAVDLVKAVFPGGSVTGAPKIRAMQIIHELENVPRDVYCGAIGYFSLNGKAQFNIAIRTMILKGGQAHFWAGGGIVADSDPEAEYQETLDKAQGIIQSL